MEHQTLYIRSLEYTNYYEKTDIWMSDAMCSIMQCINPGTWINIEHDYKTDFQWLFENFFRLIFYGLLNADDRCEKPLTVMKHLQNLYINYIDYVDYAGES